jgi:hypothetical protein
MLSHLKSATRAIHDWARPHCDKCGKRAFPHNHCNLCDSVCANNRAQALKKNYSAHKKNDGSIKQAEYICDACFNSRVLTKCAKTGAIFLLSQDRIGEFHASQMHWNLSPHHPSSQIYGSLSPEGFAIIDREHQELQSRLRSWAGCTKQDYLRGYRITKEIKLIRSDAGFDDPAAVENSLKWHCLQIGGNGLTKFFWDKNIRHHEEEYVAGYGKNGNPYHRTRRWTTSDFTGHAVAVLAETTSPTVNSKKSKEDKSTHQPSEADHWNVLGLSGNITKEDIRKAYRKAMTEYHPDKVASLGPELRALAEKKSKEINAAYNFFKKRYSI